MEITPKLGKYFGTDKGLLVVRAPEDGAGEVEEGDVLMGIDGRVPESPGHAFRILRSYQPGEKLKLDVLRNRKRLEVSVTVPKDRAMHGVLRAPHSGTFPRRRDAGCRHPHPCRRHRLRTTTARSKVPHGAAARAQPARVGGAAYHALRLC